MNNTLINTTDFSLIETLLAHNNSYFLLNLHMERLLSSANYFRSILGNQFFNFDINKIRYFLATNLATLNSDEKYKVRLLVDKNGRIDVSSILLEDIYDPIKISFSDKKVKKQDPLLYHKTTNRSLYDSELSKYRKDGFFDVIFTNMDNEITEGAVSNILIMKNGRYFTPPVSCGLLDGTYRKHLFLEKKINLEEKILYKKDIFEADKVIVINSVRKTITALLITNSKNEG